MSYSTESLTTDKERACLVAVYFEIKEKFKEMPEVMAIAMADNTIIYKK